jgi:signal transduction histidine kinase
MNELTAFLESNLIFIYFVYGLAHFVMGVAVALETGRASQLQLARALPFLAAFGITHGINEWTEMFALIAAQVSPTIPVPGWAILLRLGLKAFSFFLLFEFGARLVLQLATEQKRWIRALPALAILIYLAGLFALFLRALPAMPDKSSVSFWTNYALGLPASLLTILALLGQRRAFLRENLPQFGHDFVGAALAIGWYGLLDQMIDDATPFFPGNVMNAETFVRVIGIPVEIPRTLAVSALAFFIIRAMRVFEVEYARRLDAANRARFAAQEEAKRELTVMFETCRLLGTSLDMRQVAEDFLNQIVSLLDPVVGATVYLYDSTEGKLKMFLRRVRPGFELTLPQKECSTFAAQRAYETGDVAYEHEPNTGLAFVSVPLLSQSRIIGVLCLAHQHAFSNYTVIQTLARQLGIALENARLYNEVQEKERLRGQLLARAVAAQEEERKRIARELHDETGQLLTALAVGLGGVEQTIAQDPERAQYQIAELKNVTMHAIDGLRQFVADLRPSVLDDMGLVAALRWFAEQYAERANLRVEFQVSGTKRRLPSQVETVLFRIAQEGLNNIGRHAHATRAQLRLDFVDTLVRLTVEDDGRGFVVADVLGAQPQRRAWGLLGIQERIELVGGKFKVESAPGRGTRLSVEIPIEG